MESKLHSSHSIPLATIPQVQCVHAKVCIRQTTGYYVLCAVCMSSKQASCLHRYAELLGKPV